jgi:hypothetical protein
MKEDNNQEFQLYPFSYIYKGKKTMLLWQASEKNDEIEETFRLNAKKEIIEFNSKKELEEILGCEAKRVRWDGFAEVNFDKFWIALKNLRIGRASSTKTCTLIFNGWNIIDDLLRTIGLKETKEMLNIKRLKKIYQKLFYGCNLPSVTPEGCSYNPLWTRKEIHLMRKELKRKWSYVIKYRYIKSF